MESVTYLGQSDNLGPLREFDTKLIPNDQQGGNMRMEFMMVRKFSPWHDIDSKTDDENYVNAIIEIS